MSAVMYIVRAKGPGYMCAGRQIERVIEELI